MIIRNEERVTEVRKNMRGGSGAVTIRPYAEPNNFTAPCRLCAELIIPPGAGIGLHEHAGEDEVYIVLRGEGIISDNGKEYTVSAGDSIITGNGASHAIRNEGIEDVVIVAVIMKYNKG